MTIHSVEGYQAMKAYLHILGLLSILYQASCTNCPDGWMAFQGSCYLFPHGHADTFSNSESYCRQHHDSHLVHVDSNIENLFIQGFIKCQPDTYYWMGLTDEITDGIWRWFDDDEIATFFDWNASTGEPNGHTIEDCAVFDRTHGGHWIDLRCSGPANPICELRSDLSEIVG